MAEKFYSCN